MLIQLANDSKKPGWWQHPRFLDEQTATFIGLEAAAVRAHEIETRVVPGLLQVPEYTRVLLEGLRPADQRSPGELEDLVATRARRPARLLEGSLQYSAVMDEAIFHRTFAVPEVMAEQIHHLLDLATAANVALRVVPFGSVPYPGIDGSFSYLGFESPVLPDVVHVEGLLGNFILDRASDGERLLAAYQDAAYQGIVDRVTMSPAATLTWLKEFRHRLARASGTP
jgi:hypothetical protein